MAVELAYLQLAVFGTISRVLPCVSLLFSYTSKMPVHCTEHQDWGADSAGSGHRARFFHGLLDVVGRR